MVTSSDAAYSAPQKRPGILLIAHIVAAISIPPSYFLLSSISASDDALLGAARIGLGMLASLWAGILFYVGVFSSEKKFTARLKKFYATALQNRLLLVISLLVLASVEFVLVRQLLSVRTVTLTSATSVEVLLNDAPGVTASLGTIAGEPCDKGKGIQVPLSVGVHQVAFRVKESKDVIAARKFEIPPIWRGPVPTIPCVTEGPSHALR
jgi:hypothetical protein